MEAPAIARAERLLPALLGGTLVTLGLKRHAIGRAAIAIASGGLLYRAMSGRYRGMPSRRPAPQEPGRAGGTAEELVVQRSFTIGRPADELYKLWVDPQARAQIVGELVEVTPIAPDRWRWRMHLPLGLTTEWTTRIVEDRPGKSFRWESEEGPPLRGGIEFRPAPGDWGTEATLRLELRSPMGALGQRALRMMPGRGVIATRMLRRFKSLAETGEIPTLANNPSARRPRSLSLTGGRTDARARLEWRQ